MTTYIEPGRLTRAGVGMIQTLVQLDELAEAHISDPVAKHEARELIRLIAEGTNFQAIKTAGGVNPSESAALDGHTLDGIPSGPYPGYVGYRVYTPPDPE